MPLTLRENGSLSAQHASYPRENGSLSAQHASSPKENGSFSAQHASLFPKVVYTSLYASLLRWYTPLYMPP